MMPRVPLFRVHGSQCERGDTHAGNAAKTVPSPTSLRRGSHGDKHVTQHVGEDKGPAKDRGHYRGNGCTCAEFTIHSCAAGVDSCRISSEAWTEVHEKPSQVLFTHPGLACVGKALAREAAKGSEHRPEFRISSLVRACAVKLVLVEASCYKLTKTNRKS